jgi:PAS domain S-box-containing protein
VWWEAVIQAIPDAVVISDRNQTVVFANQAAQELWAVPESQFLGTNLLGLFRRDSSDQDRLWHFLSSEGQAGKANPGLPLQTELRQEAGTMVPCELHHSCFSVGGDNLDVLVVRDLSERKKLQQQLAQTQKLDAIGHLSAGVAHDFNNLLGVIAGNLDLLRLKLEDQPSLHGRLDTALGATRKGANLTRQLLAFSRASELKPEAVSLGPMLGNFLEMARRTVGPDIRIDLELEPDLPDLVVDISELERALLNLAVNARDAMPQGGQMRLTAQVLHIDREDLFAQADALLPGSYVVLTVSDSGEGIPPAIVQKVFEPFFTTKEKGKGTGLGLAMVYGFCKQSGGTVRLQSQEGQGTSVRLYLPIVPGSSVAVTPAETVGFVAPLGARALVVDDEPTLLEVTCSYLLDLGYQVTAASSGPEAIDRVRRGDAFSLLLTDVLMPGGMNGQQLAAAVREVLPSIKVLFTSGFPAQSFADKKLLLDSAMIPKPFVRADLVRALASLSGTPS